jgi:hypothetical protein
MQARAFQHAAGLGAALAVALLLSGCGGDKPAQPAAAAPATTAAAPAAGAAGTSGKTPAPMKELAKKADPAKTKQAEASAKLADGTYPAYLSSVNASAGTVEIDIVQFFEGQKAVEAARQDNSAADIGDDDYYIRNANPRLRTLALDPDALYDLYVTKDGLAKEVRLPELATYVRQNPKTLFWIEIAKGKAGYVYGVKL